MLSSCLVSSSIVHFGMAWLRFYRKEFNIQHVISFLILHKNFVHRKVTAWYLIVCVFLLLFYCVMYMLLVARLALQDDKKNVQESIL